MKIFVALIMITALVLADKDEYDEYRKRFNIDHTHVPHEVQLRRRNNFLESKKHIEEHNRQGHNFRLVENEYADRNYESFVIERCGTELSTSTRALPALNTPTTPPQASVNWTKFALPVVNQGSCGSCWAFSAAATIELYNTIRNKPIQPISQQHIVDCDTADKGCNGGWPKNAFDFIKLKMGTKLSNSTNYLYTATTGTCKAVPNPQPLNYGTTFQTNLNGNETLLMSYISNYGPVAIAMFVPSSGKFQLYGGGIFYDATCPVSNTTFNQCSQVNHGMVAVGYGSDATGDYFIVRNSWGAKWGEQGYIRMARNKKNNCNVACYAMGVE